MNLKQTSAASFVAGAAAFLIGSEAGILPYARDDPSDTAAVESARADLAAATARTATLETDLGAANERVDALTAELDSLEGEVSRLTADLVDRDRALEEAATDAAGNVEEIARLNVMVAERDATFEELKTAISTRDARIADLSDELQGRGIAVADAGDLPVPDLAAVPPPDAAKILGDDASPEPSLAALSSDDAPASMTQMEIFEQALSAAKPMSPLPPLDTATPASADAQTAPVGMPGQPLVQVHFETGSSQLTPGGRIRALAAAAILVDKDASAVRVTGHTDTTGSAERNLAISRQRAEAVADLFVEAGLPRDRIEIDPMGEDASVLPIPTGDGVSEPLNRCVGIFATL